MALLSWRFPIGGETLQSCRIFGIRPSVPIPKFARFAGSL